MKLIIGLGNPGTEYNNTRHNVGFMMIDYYAQKNNLTFSEKFNGLYSQTNINNEKIFFLKPQTYMNDSGTCIRKFMDYFKIDINDVFVIFDDISFDVGKFKIKQSGSAGGHNGIKSIISNLNSENFKRLKIGIGKPNVSLVDYVLGKFSKEDLNILEGICSLSSNIIEDFIKLDFNYLMQKYNSKDYEKRIIQ